MIRKKTIQFQKSKILCVILSLFTLLCHAQIIDVKKTAENAVINRTNQAINNGINLGINAIFNAPGKVYRKIQDNKKQGSAPSQSHPTGSPSTNSYNTT